MFLLATPEFHAERIETIVNGLTESQCLLEPSVDLTLRGAIFGPRFMTYEAGATFFYSRLDGSNIEFRGREVNYYFLASLFPGRRLSGDFLARRFTDKLRDNLLLFNRNRYDELGGRLQLLEGSRMPALGVGYIHRDRDTFNNRPTVILGCTGVSNGGCQSFIPVKTIRNLSKLSDSNSQLSVFLDKRNKDLQYHLGAFRTTYKSKDFGYSTTNNVVNFDVIKWLMSRRLQVFLQGYFFRTRTKTEPNEFLDAGPGVDEGEPEGGGLGLLASSEIKTTETSLDLGLHYRGTRFDHDATYDWTRTTASSVKSTQQEGNLATTYRISDKTTLYSSYGTVLVSGPGTGSWTQNLNLRLTRRTTPNLVFYVEGEGATSRNKRSNMVGLSSPAFRSRDITRADVDVGVDYTRRLGNFTAYSNLVLGAGRATLSPGGSGLRTHVEARFGVAGTAFQRINLVGHVYFQDRSDASGYGPDLQQTTAQVIATRVVGRRLQLRARAFATNIHQDRTKQVATLRRSLDTPTVLDERQRYGEIGFVAFLPRATYASLAVGRQSNVTNEGRGDFENRFNYLNASLTLHPLRHLELVGSARIQRGFQLNDIQDDRGYIDLEAIYRLRDWRFELGYTTNQYILATTDYEQRRVYFNVSRDFGWRLR